MRTTVLIVSHQKIVYAEDNSDFYVESSTPEPMDLPSVVSPADSYPWKKQLKVSSAV